MIVERMIQIQNEKDSKALPDIEWITCDACGEEYNPHSQNHGDVHRCGPKNWAAETNRLLQQLIHETLKNLVREEVVSELNRRESA